MLIFTRSNDFRQLENEDFWAPYSAYNRQVVSFLAMSCHVNPQSSELQPKPTNQV